MTLNLDKQVSPWKQDVNLTYIKRSEDLQGVELGKSTIIHIKNIITLLTEVYKTTWGENPIFMNKIFTQKSQY